MRHLIPDAQTPNPKLTFYHPMLPKGLFSKPRPYTYQVGSRHSPDTKNTKIYVLGAENCKIHQALKHLRQLISE